MSLLEVHQLASNVRHNISMLRLEIQMAAKGKITLKSQHAHVTNLAGLICLREERGTRPRVDVDSFWNF